MDIQIIGAGINGLCTAYFLNKAGYSVQIFDKSKAGTGSSYGNAGMIVPSHFVPMASPGTIAKGIKYLFSPTSSFSVRPRLNSELVKWLWKFYRSSTQQHVENVSKLIWNLNEQSKDTYAEIVREEHFDVDFQEKGLLMLFRSEKAQREEYKAAEIAEKLGIPVQSYSLDELKSLMQVEMDILGAVYYPGDAHLYSNEFMKQLFRHLEKSEVKFHNVEIVNFETHKARINSLIDKNGNKFKVNKLIVAGGAWSTRILKKIGIKLLLQDGKGYSVTMKDQDEKPSIPCILSEDHVAITPMKEHLRITGVLEISGLNSDIDYRRLNGFLSAVPKYFPEIKPGLSPGKEDVWVGYRPISPDGLPILGQVEQFENLYLNTGQGMMGMSLGPISGKIISNIIEGKETEIEKMELIDANRFLN